MSKDRGRLPDWDLSYLNKETDDRGNVGCAWNNDDGSIRIKLNALVTLTAGPSCILTLFKRKGGPRRNDPEKENSDNIPF